MTTEREGIVVGLKYSNVDGVVADIQRIGRKRSMDQLAFLLPSSQIQNMMALVSNVFPDVVMSPKLPFDPKELQRLQVTGLADLGEVSAYGEVAVETGLGWRFEPRGESGFTYIGVRVLSFPDHVVIAGAAPQRIDLNRTNLGPRDRIEVFEAFKSTVMRSPGLHYLGRNKMNPKVRG